MSEPSGCCWVASILGVENIIAESYSGLIARRLQSTTKIRSRPGKPNQKKGQNEKFIWISRPFFVNSGVFFPGENKHDSQVELLFRNAPAKSSRTGLSLVWFAGATPDKRCQSRRKCFLGLISQMQFFTSQFRNFPGIIFNLSSEMSTFWGALLLPSLLVCAWSSSGQAGGSCLHEKSTISTKKPLLEKFGFEISQF